MLEETGYALIGYFTLPPDCWVRHDDQPIERGLEAFLARHEHHETARGIAEGEREEISLYRRFGAYYSYGVCIARRVD